MERKKIVIFMDWYKPGYKAGGPIQSISNLVSLLFGEYDFYVVTRNLDYLETSSYPDIDSGVWIKSREESIFYLEYNKLSYSKIKEVIREISPDMIYLNSLYSIYFSLIPILLARGKKIKTLLAVRGMLSEGSFSVKKKKKLLFLFLFKLLGLHKIVKFHATTVGEKMDILNKMGSQVDVQVVQNVPRIKFNTQFKSRGDTLKIIFVGRIAPEKNLLFAIKAAKLVKSKVLFCIYGPVYNQAYWSLCKSEIERCPTHVNIKYQGVLPHSKLDATLSAFHVLFLPSTGENFGHIISEAMMNYCIPLISNKTPWRNLEKAKVGFDLAIDQEILFAEKIDYLASIEKIQLERMAKSANRFVNNQVDTITLHSSYKKLFN